MITSGIVNPQLLSLLSRVRHTNSLGIADGGFPSWPGLETVDLSLVRGLPTVRQVLSPRSAGLCQGLIFLRGK